MKKFALFFIAITFSLSMFLVPGAIAKTVSIPSVDMVVTILPDGSAYVQENRTIEFDGYFSFGFYEIPKKGYGSIQNVSVAEGDQYYQYESIATYKQNTFTITDTESNIRIDYNFSATDEARTFTIRYKIKDVVSVYQDYGEFYWKLQGDGWDFDVKDFSAVVQWKDPIPTSSYHIWAHGPLWGDFIKTDEKTSFLNVKDLPPNTFVETRVLLRSSYFTVSKKQGTIYEKVIQEETVFANEANAERRQARKLMLLATIFKWITFGLAALFILFYFFLFNKYGMEHKIVNASIYYREPPSDLKPAIVGMLSSFQNYQNRFLEATLMDLIRRRHIQYEEIPGDYLTKDNRLTLLKQKGDSLEDYETFLLEELIFEGKTNVTMRGLKKKFLAGDGLYFYQFQKFKRMIKDTTKPYAFFDAESNKYSTLAVILGVVLFFSGFIGGIMVSFTFLGMMNFVYMLLIPVGLFYIFGAYALKRRTENGALEYSKWKAFSSFMKDFSNLKEYGPKSVIIWERFLVYATVFGIATVVLKAFKLVAPSLYDTNRGALLGPALFTASALQGSSITNAMSGISSMSRSISRVASSSSSSSSGSGGGFSSGGGGGGGGSGGGFG